MAPASRIFIAREIDSKGDLNGAALFGHALVALGRSQDSTRRAAGAVLTSKPEIVVGEWHCPNPVRQAHVSDHWGDGKFERSLIQERVRAGLRNAKPKGKTLGRPRRIVKGDQMAKLRDKGRVFARLQRPLVRPPVPFVPVC
jgi:hypothetical protein